jgi:hypothetical protein
VLCQVLTPGASRCTGCRDFEAQVADGRLVAGQHDTYHGNQPLAYGCDPAENVVFNGCHDNETIFDQVCCLLPCNCMCSVVEWCCGVSKSKWM